jgi:hypothetical protein
VLAGDFAMQAVALNIQQRLPIELHAVQMARAVAQPVHRARVWQGGSGAMAQRVVLVTADRDVTAPRTPMALQLGHQVAGVVVVQLHGAYATPGGDQPSLRVVVEMLVHGRAQPSARTLRRVNRPSGSRS